MPWLAGAGAAGAGAAGTTIGATAGSTLGAAGTAAMSTVPSAALSTGGALGGSGLGIGGALSAGTGAGGLGLGGAAATPALSMGATPSFWDSLAGSAKDLGQNLLDSAKQNLKDRVDVNGRLGLPDSGADPKAAQPKRIGTAKQKLPKLEAQDTSSTPAPMRRFNPYDANNPNASMQNLLVSLFPRG